MTKKIKKATTNKLIFWYTNDTSYTIPRVENFTVSRDGKSVSGNYTKTVTFHGITEKQNIAFTIDLVDVVGMSYDAKHGQVDKTYQVYGGRILSVTEHRTEADYYKEDPLTLMSEAMTDAIRKISIIDIPTNPFFELTGQHTRKFV